MQIRLSDTRELYHEFHQLELSKLLQIRQQHQTLYPSRYTYTILGDDLLEHIT